MIYILCCLKNHDVVEFLNRETNFDKIDITNMCNYLTYTNRKEECYSKQYLRQLSNVELGRCTVNSTDGSKMFSNFINNNSVRFLRKYF